MTAYPSNPATPSTHQPGRTNPGDARDELKILGHLLGRREGIASIAHAVGLSADRAQALCDALCAQGKLSVTTGARGPQYALSFRAPS